MTEEPSIIKTQNGKSDPESDDSHPGTPVQPRDPGTSVQSLHEPAVEDLHAEMEPLLVVEGPPVITLENKADLIVESNPSPPPSPDDQKEMAPLPYQFLKHVTGNVYKAVTYLDPQQQQQQLRRSPTSMSGSLGTLAAAAQTVSAADPSSPGAAVKSSPGPAAAAPSSPVAAAKSSPTTAVAGGSPRAGSVSGYAASVIGVPASQYRHAGTGELKYPRPVSVTYSTNPTAKQWGVQEAADYDSLIQQNIQKGPGIDRYLEDQFERWAAANMLPALPQPIQPIQTKLELERIRDCDEKEALHFSQHFSRFRRGPQEKMASPTSTERQKMNKMKRVVMKGGTTNVHYKNISKKRRKYFSDIYTTLLDSDWTYLVGMFAASFYVSWLLFGVLYYIVCSVHGDFQQAQLPDEEKNQDFVPCILEVFDFASCFLFSLETQHTIGYGSRQTTTECAEAMILMSLQSVLGCLIQAFMVGLVFSKLARPGSRSKTVIFSQNAVVTLRNKRLCLIFRIGDLRDENFILGINISAKLLRRRITKEGEIYEEMTSLPVSPDTTAEPCIFFVWPLEVVHVIDKDSPLYDLSASGLSKEKFELIVVMEGCIETTSMNFQSRTSYLANEILWGHRFEPMNLYRKDQNKFQINFAAFDSVYEVEDTPSCSARELDSWQEKEAHQHQQQQQQQHQQQQFQLVGPHYPHHRSGSMMNLLPKESFIYHGDHPHGHHHQQYHQQYNQQNGLKP